MPPPLTLTTLYCDEDDVDAVLSAEGVDAWLDDDQSGSVSPAEEARLTVHCINWATAECNFYLQGQYDPAQLVNSWKVNEWCTDFAARRLCLRRGNPVPDSLNERCGTPDAETGHYHQLTMCRDGVMNLNDINARVSDVPGMSNVRVDPLYGVRQVRVERPLSDQTPRMGPVQTDFVADACQEP